jgi:hypothetical protein
LGEDLADGLDETINVTGAKDEDDIECTRGDNVRQFGFRAATLIGDGDVLEDHL